MEKSAAHGFGVDDEDWHLPSVTSGLPVAVRSPSRRAVSRGRRVHCKIGPSFNSTARAKPSLVVRADHRAEGWTAYKLAPLLRWLLCECRGEGLPKFFSPNWKAL